MIAATPKRTITLLRVVISALLDAFAVFIAQYKRSTPHSKPNPSLPLKPFVTDAPSSEGANRFAWVPPYPGAALQNITTKQTHDQLSYGFSFRTEDEFKHILAFYRERLQAAGFQVEVNDSREAGGELHAMTDGGIRSFDAIAVKILQGPGTEVGITAVQR